MANEIITKLVVDLSKPKGHPDRVQSIPLTAEELEQRELDRIAAEAAEAERLALETAKAEAKAAAHSKLEALGLTPEEIAAITGA
jgi:hypothetical protein